MATHKIAVARQTAGESHKQSGLLMQVTAETTGFIIIKRKTTPGRGKGRIYSTEAQRIPASLRQGDIFFYGGREHAIEGFWGEKKGQRTAVKLVGRSPVRQSHVCHHNNN